MDPTVEAAILKPYTSPASLQKNVMDPDYETLFKAGKASDLLDAAGAKLSDCVSNNDKAGQAKALHACSLGAILNQDFTTATKKAKDAVQIYRSLHSKADLAFELQAIAYYYLEQDKAQKALPAAQEAWRLQKDLGNSGAVALYLTVIALIGKYQRKRAVKTAKENLDKLTDETDQDIVMEALVMAYLSMEQTGDAAETLEEAPQTTSNFFLKYKTNLVAKDYDAATAALDDIVEQSEGVGQESGDALIEKAKVAFETQDYATAMSSAQDAKEVFSGDSNKSDEARCMLVVALAHSKEQQYEDAIATATEAQELYTEAADMMGTSLSLRLIAEVYMMMSSPDKAIESAKQALAQYEELGSRKGMGATQSIIATALVEMGDLTGAENIAREAMSNSNTTWDMRSMLASTNVLTKICLIQLSIYADYEGHELQMKPPKAFVALREKARSSANEGVVFSGKVNDKALRASALFMKANVMTWCFLSDKAVGAATEAAKLYHEAANESGEATALTFLIDLYALLGSFDKGRECAETAIEITRDLQDINMEKAVLEAWGRLDDKEYGKVIVQEYVAAPVQQMGGVDFGGMVAAGGGGGGGGSVAAEAAKAKLDPVATTKKLMELVINVMASDDEVAEDSPLMEAGMDSLSSVQFVNEVSREFQMSFSPSLVFDFPTVSSLTNHIIEAVQG